MSSILRNFSSTLQIASATGAAERYFMRNDRTADPLSANGMITPSPVLRVDRLAVPSRSSRVTAPIFLQEEISGKGTDCVECSPAICCVTSPKVCCTKKLPLLRSSGDEPE